MQFNTNDIVYIYHQTFKKLKSMSNFQNQRMQFNTNDIVYIYHQTFKKLKSMSNFQNQRMQFNTYDIVYIYHQTFKKLKSITISKTKECNSILMILSSFTTKPSKSKIHVKFPKPKNAIQH